MNSVKERFPWLFKYLCTIFIISLIAIVTSCGGDDGDEGDSFSTNDNDDGNPPVIDINTQATITEANAEEIAINAYAGFDTETVPTNIGTTQVKAGNSIGLLQLLKINQALDFSFQQVKSIDSINKSLVFPAQESSNTVEGDCGGTATVTMETDEETGDLYSTIFYDSFCLGGTTYSGTVTISITHDPVTEEIETMTVSYDNLSMIMESYDYNVTMDGYLEIVFIDSVTQITMDMEVTDNITGDLIWIDNYVMTIEEGSDYTDVEFSGRFHDSRYGYVDISTPESFTTMNDELYPYKGILIVVGAGNTKARLTVLDSSTFIVEADTDGDDIYEWSSGVKYWSEI